MKITDNDGFALFDSDPLTGRTMWIKYEDGRAIIRTCMPLEDVFRANHELEAATHGRAFGDYNMVASVPAHLYYASGLSDAMDQRDDAWLSRYLNDPGHQKLRTSRGKV